MYVSLDAAEWVLNRCVLEGQKLKMAYLDDLKSDRIDETDGKANGVFEPGNGHVYGNKGSLLGSRHDI